MTAGKTIQLDELCEIQSGGTPSRSNPDFYGGNIPWAIIADMETTNGFVCKTKNQITDAGLKAIRGRIFPKGTILLAMYGSVGKTAVAGTLLSTNQAILGIQIKNESLLNSKYLHYWLNQQQPHLVKMARGVTQKNISATIVRNLKISLPSLEEQKRIAELLDKADELRRKRRDSIAALDSLTQSIFLDFFDSPESKKWPMTTVEVLAASGKGTIRTGPFGSQLLHSEFVDEGIAVLGIDNAVQNRFCWAKPRFITEEKYEKLTRYTVRPRDVLITIMGTCGRCAIVPETVPLAINTKHLCCITLNRKKCLPEFLHAYFLLHPTAQRYLMQKAKGAIMDGLNMGTIKELPVPVVPMELQLQFKAASEKIETQRTKLLTAQSKTENLFLSLQQKAFQS